MIWYAPFHDETRVLTSEQDEGDFGDDQTLLDLGILGRPALLHHTAPAAPANE